MSELLPVPIEVGAAEIVMTGATTGAPLAVTDTDVEAILLVPVALVQVRL
jgi:hypothetical protein